MGRGGPYLRAVAVLAFVTGLARHGRADCMDFAGIFPSARERLSLSGRLVIEASNWTFPDGFDASFELRSSSERIP